MAFTMFTMQQIWGFFIDNSISYSVTEYVLVAFKIKEKLCAFNFSSELLL